jgi:hypothetical protein
MNSRMYPFTGAGFSRAAQRPGLQRWSARDSRSTHQCPRNFVFRVTIVSSYASVVAAINESTAGKGLPVRDVCDRSVAQRTATRRSRGSTRPENHASRSRVSHSLTPASLASRPVVFGKRWCMRNPVIRYRPGADSLWAAPGQDWLRRRESSAEDRRDYRTAWAASPRRRKDRLP